MQSAQSGGQALVETSRSFETDDPSEGAFDDPSARQQHGGTFVLTIQLRFRSLSLAACCAGLTPLTSSYG